MASVCVIREWYYPICARVSREVDALLRAGHQVDVICVARQGQPRLERIGALSVHRLPIARRRGSALRYLFEYTMFLVAAGFLAAKLHLRRRFDLVQVNSMPDALVFAALVPRLLGARVLLDLHEVMPEYFGTKYKRPLSHPVVRVLAFIEQQSIRFAHAVITCTDPMRERFIERGAPPEKIAVLLNALDEEKFDTRSYRDAARSDDDFVLVSHGTIDESYGVDLTVRAVALLKDTIPGLRLRIYGDGPRREALRALVSELDLDDQVWFSAGWLPRGELLPRVAEADAGVRAVRRDAFTDMTNCNKMYELVALRKPVIISRTRAVEAYFGDDCFQFFQSGNVSDLARAIREIYVDPGLRSRLVRRASEVAEPYRWAHQQKRYLGIVQRLVGRADMRGRPRATVVKSGGEP